MPWIKEKKRTINGQALIETVVGCLVLVPIGLFLLDVGALVLAQTANDNMAKHAARAAAGQANAGQARTAAQQVTTIFPRSTLVSNPTLSAFDYGSVNPQVVNVRTTIT